MRRLQAQLYCRCQEEKPPPIIGTQILLIREDYLRELVRAVWLTFLSLFLAWHIGLSLRLKSKVIDLKTFFCKGLSVIGFDIKLTFFSGRYSGIILKF